MSEIVYRYDKKAIVAHDEAITAIFVQTRSEAFAAAKAAETLMMDWQITNYWEADKDRPDSSTSHYLIRVWHEISSVPADQTGEDGKATSER